MVLQGDPESFLELMQIICMDQIWAVKDRAPAGCYSKEPLGWGFHRMQCRGALGTHVGSRYSAFLLDYFLLVASLHFLEFTSSSASASLVNISESIPLGFKASFL